MNWKCKICGRVYKKKSSALSHIRDGHKKRKQSENVKETDEEAHELWIHRKRGKRKIIKKSEMPREVQNIANQAMKELLKPNELRPFFIVTNKLTPEILNLLGDCYEV